MPADSPFLWKSYSFETVKPKGVVPCCLHFQICFWHIYMCDICDEMRNMENALVYVKLDPVYLNVI
jgi:hypothetical protein